MREMHRTYFQEWFASFSYSFTGIPINVLLTDMRTPLLGGFFSQNIRLIPGHKETGDIFNKFGVVHSYETFHTTKQSLLVLFLSFNGADKLSKWLLFDQIEG